MDPYLASWLWVCDFRSLSLLCIRTELPDSNPPLPVLIFYPSPFFIVCQCWRSTYVVFFGSGSWIRISLHVHPDPDANPVIRIHGVRNRPDKKSYKNFSWKCVFFFAFHGINLKGRNCSSDFNKNFLPNPLCLFTRSFMMRFACLPVCSWVRETVCSWVRERANHATVCLGKEGSRSASLNPTASPPVLNRRPNSWIPLIKKAGNPAK